MTCVVSAVFVDARVVVVVAIGGKVVDVSLAVFVVVCLPVLVIAAAVVELILAFVVAAVDVGNIASANRHYPYYVEDVSIVIHTNLQQPLKDLVSVHKIHTPTYIRTYL